MTALIASNTKTFFAAPSRAYRYWLTPRNGEKHAVLKLQVKRELIAKFRNSARGRSLQHLVDIYEIGGGWFEITGRDLTKAVKTDVGHLLAQAFDGMRAWIKQFNLVHFGDVNANSAFSPFIVERSNHRVIREQAEQDRTARLAKGVNALAAKFGKAVAA